MTIDHDMYKQKLNVLEEKDQQKVKEKIGRSGSQIIRIRHDIEPKMPSIKFIEGMEKHEQCRKPRGCAMSMFMLERMENEPERRLN
jgi:hypothetical protein